MTWSDSRLTWPDIVALQDEAQTRFESTLPATSDVLANLRRCGTYPDGRFWVCRQVSCRHCGRRYAKEQFRRNAVHFAPYSKEQMAFATVVLDAVEEPSQIAGVVDKARTAISYIFRRERSQSTRWDGVRLTGWLETDALAGSQLSMIGIERGALTAALAPQMSGQHPVFFPTIHAVVGLHRLEYQEFRAAFASRWSLPGQVDVRPFYKGFSKAKSLFCTTRYAIKRSRWNLLGNQYQVWPAEWVAAYENWHLGWSKSFQRTRFTCRPSAGWHSNRISEVMYRESSILDSGITTSDATCKHDPTDEYGAMPCVF